MKNKTKHKIVIATLFLSIILSWTNSENYDVSPVASEPIGTTEVL